jgi:hypothetical protein
MILNAFFIYQYYTRRGYKIKSWFDEPIAWSIAACGTAFFVATIILGQFADYMGNKENYGALGLAYYAVAGFFAFYFLYEAWQLVFGEAGERIDEGRLRRGDL